MFYYLPLIINRLIIIKSEDILCIHFLILKFVFVYVEFKLDLNELLRYSAF